MLVLKYEYDFSRINLSMIFRLCMNDKSLRHGVQNVRERLQPISFGKLDVDQSSSRGDKDCNQYIGVDCIYIVTRGT